MYLNPNQDESTLICGSTNIRTEYKAVKPPASYPFSLQHSARLPTDCGGGETTDPAAPALLTKEVAGYLTVVSQPYILWCSHVFG